MDNRKKSRRGKTLKRLTALLLAVMFALSFAGCSGNKDSGHEDSGHEDSNSDVVDGYKYGDFDTYNSYAEDNGLAGDKIYIKGKVKSVNNYAGHMCFSVVSEDKGKWLTYFLTEGDTDKADSLFDEKEVTCFGEYQGYSDTFQMPAIFVDYILYNGEEYRSSDFNVGTDTSDVSTSPTKKPTEKPTEKPTKKPTEKPTEKPTVKPTEKPTERPTDNKADSVPTEYKNALRKAESYSEMMHMSKNAIYKQLTSEYGEGFPAEAAQYAIDNINADWNKNALEKAKTYYNDMSMSKSAIYDQLISEYGEQFTESEAQYAIDHLDD